MTFQDLLARFTAAVEAGDGDALGGLFTADGVYQDTFYGAFEGPAAIKDMLENHFWRDAEAFRWDMREPVAAGGVGYANWSFSYASKLPGVEGRRVLFEGMSRFRLAADGEAIRRYDEVFDMGVALAQTGFDAGRIHRIVDKAATRLRTRHAGTRHLRD